MGKSHKASKNHPQLRSRTTRSSKGRLLSDPAENNQLLTEQLRSLGLYAAPTLGDGNCLFRALSDQLYGSPSKHHQLRAAICDWIESHKTRYAPFVEDERGLDVHLRCMRENATYGGHMELSAFAHMTKRNVKVVQPGLVYVIEWASGTDPSSPTFPSSPTTSDRKLRSDDRRASTSSSHSFDDEDGERSTVYVAYHDWEHFSSIRNLKGPHSGLPNVSETPAVSLPITAPLTPKKAREQERKEKEKERKTQKVKLKLKVSAPSPVKGPVSAVMRDVEGDDDDDDDPVEWAADAEDPTQVPLPCSRGISCEPVPSRPPLPQSASSSAPNSTASTSSSSSASSSAPQTQSQLQLQPPQRTTRSPKRSFDESSASASASDTDDRHLVERGRDKRTRRNTGAGCDVLMASPPTPHPNPPEDADTPELSAPGSPSPSSSEASSLSRCSSAFGSPPPPPAAVDVLPIPSKKSKSRALHPHPMTGYERPLTRRQRKALGLPKLRPGLGSSPSPGAIERTGSAGTIVIPDRKSVV